MLWFGFTIENLLAETNEVGMGAHKRREPRYTLEQLLDPLFHPPKPQAKPKVAPVANGFAALIAMSQQAGSGIKRWEYIKPS